MTERKVLRRFWAWCNQVVTKFKDFFLSVSENFVKCGGRLHVCILHYTLSLELCKFSNIFHFSFLDGYLTIQLTYSH